jgi:twitching motility protein PilT
LRIDGELRTLRDVPPLSADFLHSLALSLLNDRRRDTLERTGDVTLALGTGLRQRIQIVQQRGGLGLSLRLIPSEVPRLQDLGLPAEARSLTERGPGLVLVAAGSGQGKSTTLAALIDDLGLARPCRVLTIEDPVELVLKDRHSVVVQREVGTDVPSVAAALRAASRQDIDLLAVGEIEDREVAELVFGAAEAGRLVLTGVAAGGPTAAIGRLTGLWPPEARPRARARLAAILRGILWQRLVPTGDGRRRAAAGALLPAGPEVRRAIAAWDGDTAFEPEALPGLVTFEPGPRPARRRRDPEVAAQPAVEDEAGPD